MTRSPIPIPILALILATGCHRADPGGGAPGAEKAAAKTSKEYPLKGTVRAVKMESGQVVIHHDAIDGFMAEMTMPFTVKNRALLDEVDAGDEVVGTLRVVYAGGLVQDYELMDLIVSKPALPPPPSLTVSVAGGRPRLQATPRPLEPGEEVPDFAMTTEDGQSRRLSELRGDVVVLTFIYTRCPLPDFCPLMDRKFAGLASAIGAQPERARHVRLISLSFDPEHDTPEVLRKHARTQGAQAPLWTFAVASHDELARVAPALGLTYGPTATEIIHNLSTAVIGPDGQLVSLRVGPAARSWGAGELLKEIVPLLPGRGAGG
jgi:protein SCO1/2